MCENLITIVIPKGKRFCLNASPGLVNTDPYQDGWLIKVQISAAEGLLTFEQYQEYLQAF